MVILITLVLAIVVLGVLALVLSRMQARRGSYSSQPGGMTTNSYPGPHNGPHAPDGSSSEGGRF